MAFKAGLLFLALLAGSIAFLVEEVLKVIEDEVVEQVMSIFFMNVDESARILGGTTAGNVPYLVALTTGDNVRNLLCGASMISGKRVLTAAHCITSLPSSLRGNVGTTRFASGGTSFGFSRRVLHPSYNSAMIKNDIGILVTSINVPLSGSVAIVPLNWNFVGAGVATTTTGWGQTSTNGLASQVLLRLFAITVDGNECRNRVAQRAQQIGLPAPPVDPNVEICTFNSNTRGMCRGDSGSALMSGNQQIGIVSWGLPCARGAPVMFVRNSVFRSWVEQNMQ